MEPNYLGARLRELRESNNLGPIKVACGIFGVSHATLGAYEQGKGLPDVDFLATFADKTGADFNELLRLRLASGKTDSARALSETLELPEKAHGARLVLDEAEAFLNTQQDFPLAVVGETADAEVVSVYQSLKDLVHTAAITPIERAQAYRILDLAFDDKEAQLMTGKTAASLKNRIQTVNRSFQESAEAIGWKPPLFVRQAITGAMLFHGLTEEGAAYQLSLLYAQAQSDVDRTQKD